MRDVVIVEAVRTPVGRFNGMLKDVHPVDLGAHILKAVVERAGIEQSDVDDVVMGCVTQVNEQGGNVGRLAVLNATATLEISDDGIGFDPSLRAADGFGLPGMRERVERLGGRFSIESSPGAGTRIHVEVPA